MTGSCPRKKVYFYCSATAIASMLAKNFKSGATSVDGATFDMDCPVEAELFVSEYHQDNQRALT